MNQKLLGLGCGVLGCGAALAITVGIAVFLLIPAVDRARDDAEAGLEVAAVESATAETATAMTADEGSTGSAPSWSEPVNLSGDDTLGLTISREGAALWVEQSAWGLSFELPEPTFTPVSNLESQLNAGQAQANQELETGNSVYWWALATADQRRHVQVQALKGMPNNETEFREMVDGLALGLEEGGALDIQRRQERWENGQGVAILQYQISGVEAEFRCKSGRRPSGMPSMICLQLIGLEPAVAKQIFGSLQTGG